MLPILNKMIPEKFINVVFITTYILLETKSFSQAQHKYKIHSIKNHNGFSSFNHEPKYIFVLPENKTLIFTKQDFQRPILPNVTNLNNFPDSKKKQEIIKDSQSSSSTNQEKYKKYVKELNKYNNDYENVVEENVQTERNFVNFLNEMNNDLSLEEVRTNNNKIKDKSVVRQNNKGNKHKNEQEWSELGLDGWKGAITSKRKNTTNKEKPEEYEIVFYSKPEDTPPYHHLIPSASGNIRGIRLEGNYLPQVPDSQEITEELPKELQILIEEEKKLYTKKHGTTKENLQWPITSSRDSHKDDDVFIARANNPFGHSTKWKYRHRNATDENSTGSRTKRGAVQLYSMIKCSTGCDPLIYKGYGCYCGFLGSGLVLDGIDRCCKMHDYCYETANCPSFLEYFVPYLWKCYRGKPLCAYDHGDFGGPNSCAARLCECDLILSSCLRRHYCPRKRNVCISNPLRLIQNLAMVF